MTMSNEHHHLEVWKQWATLGTSALGVSFVNGAIGQIKQPRVLDY